MSLITKSLSVVALTVVASGASAEILVASSQSVFDALVADLGGSVLIIGPRRGSTFIITNNYIPRAGIYVVTGPVPHEYIIPAGGEIEARFVTYNC